MTPIPPKAVLFLMQSGWAVDMIFPIAVDSINGLRSRVAAGANQRPGDPGYYRVVTLMREVQKSGTVGMRVIKQKEDKETTVLFFHGGNVAPETAAMRRELNSLLGLDPENQEITFTYGNIPKNNQEIAMLTRSMMQIMVDLAGEIDVPPEHVADGRTIPFLAPPAAAEEKIGQLIQVKTGRDKPENAFTAVNYEDHWFWIDKRDFKSKRTLSFLMVLFSLTETGGKEALPLVTIPAG